MDGVPESTPARFSVFLSDTDQKSKICEKSGPDLKIFSSIDDNWSMNRSRKLQLDR